MFWGLEEPSVWPSLALFQVAAIRMGNPSKALQIRSNHPPGGRSCPGLRAKESAKPERSRNSAMRPNSQRTAFDFVRKTRRTKVTTKSPSKAIFRDHVKWPKRKAPSGDHILGEKERKIDTDRIPTWTKSRMCSLSKQFGSLSGSRKVSMPNGTTERKNRVSERLSGE